MKNAISLVLAIFFVGPLAAQNQMDDAWLPSAQKQALQEVTRVPFREIKIGDQLSQWTIDALGAEKTLVDGRSTNESCGYRRQVQVHRPHPGAGLAGLSAQALDKRSGVIAITCVRNGDLLVPGSIRLLLSRLEPAQNQADASAASAGRAPVPAVDKPVPAVDKPAQPDNVTAEHSDHPGASADPAMASSASNRHQSDEVRELQAQDGSQNKRPGDDENLPPLKLGKAAFYKGELSKLGSVQLINARDSVGVGLGADLIDGVLYAALIPNLNFHQGRFAMGFGTPLRFELLNLGAAKLMDPSTYALSYANAGKFRRQDWDHAFAYPYNDLLRPIRYLSWGRKEDHLYIDVNRVRALTIGHGQLMRRYAPNADIEDSRLFAELDAYNDYLGVEAVAGPLPIPRVLGALVFVKPLSLFFDDFVSKSLSFGLSYVTDLNAPTGLRSEIDALDGRKRFLIENHDFVYASRDQFLGPQVQGAGIDAEIKLVKNDVLDLKVYGDYSELFLPALSSTQAAFHAGGATLGSLLRMSFGSRPLRDLNDETEDVRLGIAPRELKAAHALRLRLEMKTFAPQYLPSYFDSLYEVDRFQLMSEAVDEQSRSQLPTKIEYLASQAGQAWRLGYYFEGTYTWVDRLALSVIYEDAWQLGADYAAVSPGRNLVLHAETQGLGFLQLFATYHYHNFQLQDWARVLQFSRDNEVLYLGGRLQILILAINLGVQRGFRLDALDGDAGQVQLQPNGVVYERSSTGLRNQWNFMFNLELGWQF